MSLRCLQEITAICHLPQMLGLIMLPKEGKADKEYGLMKGWRLSAATFKEVVRLKVTSTWWQDPRSPCWTLSKVSQRLHWVAIYWWCPWLPCVPLVQRRKESTTDHSRPPWPSSDAPVSTIQFKTTTSYKLAWPVVTDLKCLFHFMMLLI